MRIRRSIIVPAILALSAAGSILAWLGGICRDGSAGTRRPRAGRRPLHPLLRVRLRTVLFYPDPQEGQAWTQASDEAWAERAAAAYTAAVERGDDVPLLR